MCEYSLEKQKSYKKKFAIDKKFATFYNFDSSSYFKFKLFSHFDSKSYLKRLS